MSLEIINENEQKVSVKIKGVPLQYTNALRRICLNGVPIYAVESIDVLENSSVLADEGVAHRVGLIPLKTDLSASKNGNENDKIMLTERGTFFGYNRLVNDMTAITAMKQLGCPVVFDATHSTQQPGGLGDTSAGSRQMAPILAKAAIAAGANGLFLEVHTDPENAKCDAACIMPIEWVKDLLTTCKKIFQLVRS